LVSARLLVPARFLVSARFLGFSKVLGSSKALNMTDIAKREPSMDTPIDRPAPSYVPAPGPAPTTTLQASVPLSERGGLDQLSRIEEKSARIEEKFARTEALLLRLEATFQDALTKFGGLARTADVNALEGRVRGLPGVGAIFVVAVIAALVGAAVTLAALKFGIPGFLAAR
jgi:hypothetical protein